MAISVSETGVEKTVLDDFLNTTEGMSYVSNGYNDDGTFSTAGLSDFLFNGISASTLYISSNHWIGFGANTSQLYVMQRDGCSTAIWRQEGTCGNGVKFLKIRFEGYTVYSQRYDSNRLIFELFIMSNRDTLAISPYSGTLQYVYTSYTGGNTGDKYSGCTVGTTELLFLLDPDNDTAYYFKIKNANSISIVKRRMYLKSVSVFENPYSQKALIEETELDALATALSTSYIAYNYDVNENCLYIFSSANYYINTNGAFQITRIKLSDWSIRQWTMTNTTNEQLNTNGMRFAFADNGFVYLKGYNSPFQFELAGVVVNDSVTREAITKDQMRKFLRFVHDDILYCKYYEVVYILFHTGMRISEFCGLTLKDIDLEHNTVNIERQLQRTAQREYVIEPTKTNAGTRVLPITDEVAEMFRSIIQDRPKYKVEKIVGGYSGFLFLDKDHMPLVAMHWEHRFNSMVGRYNEIYKVQMPNITPHVCRHTYCSNQAKAGMNPKTLQYLMGHSDIAVTLNVYTHVGLEDAANELRKMQTLEGARKEMGLSDNDDKPLKQNMFKVV